MSSPCDKKTSPYFPSSGPVVFLEEDHYVAEDFLHMLSLLRATADRACPQCEVLCLGTYLKTYQYHAQGDKVGDL